MVTLFCMPTLFSEGSVSTHDVFSVIISLFSFLVSCTAIFISKKELRISVNKQKCEILADYNRRYGEDDYIQKVVKDYLNCGEIHPTAHDKEMFLRFFEELELMIQKEYISEDDAYNFFSFYFTRLWNDDNKFWTSDMKTPYESMEDAQNAPEWSMAKKLYDRLSHKKGSTKCR